MNPHRRWLNPWWTLKWKVYAVPRLYSLSFSPDGKRVAVGGVYGEVQMWDTQSGKSLAKWWGDGN